MDRNNFSQNNPNDNVHESNVTGFNNYPNNLPPTTNTDYNDSSMMNNIPAHAPNNDVNTSGHNYQQFMPNDASTSQSYPQYPQYPQSYPQYPQYTQSYPQPQYAQSYPQYSQYTQSYPQYPQYTQSYPQYAPYIAQNPLNSFNITFSSSQTGFKLIFIPITSSTSPILTNSNIQSQPQQDNTYMNHSSSNTITDNP